MDEKEGSNVLEHLNQKYRKKFGGRIVDWSPVHASEAHVEALRYLKAFREGRTG
jgi:hypothetical protein